VNAIPEGYHSVTPYLVVDDAARAINFYQQASGAQETVRMNGPDGKIAHAELRLGDSMIMLSSEMTGSEARSPRSLGGATTSIFL
jgi:PhnB protein